MNIGDRIATTRRANLLTAQQLSRMVDVSPSTVTRIEAGTVNPSFNLAQALLAALGQTLDSRPTDSTSAIAAVRKAIGSPISDSVASLASDWLSRWQRFGLLDDSDQTVLPSRRFDLLQRAAKVAPLARRAGATSFEPADWWAVAESLDSPSIEWAATGSVAANRYVESAGTIWPVFYVSDMEVATELIGLRRLTPDQYGPRVTLIPFDGASEIGRTRDDDGLWLAAREQIMLDCLAGIGRMPEQAEAMVLSEAGQTL